VRWQLQIIYHLLNGTRRFGELQRLIPDASRQMLTLQLRELEQLGMLHREAYDQVPPKVEYSLTELGCSFEPVLRQFLAWGEEHQEQLGVEWSNLLLRPFLPAPQGALDPAQVFL
jgi:DNA-binding HxlR family transcriptional regulator